VLATKEMLGVAPSIGTKNALKLLVWSLIGSKSDNAGSSFAFEFGCKGQIESLQQKLSQRNCGERRNIRSKERRWRSRDHEPWK
jgi:hypothetical protein